MTFAKAIPLTTLSTDEQQQETTVIRASGTVLVRTFVPFTRRALIEGVYGAKIASAKKTNGVVENGDAAHEDASFAVPPELDEALRAWESWLEDSTTPA
jgi:hypothetical protein